MLRELVEEILFRDELAAFREVLVVVGGECDPPTELFEGYLLSACRAAAILHSAMIRAMRRVGGSPVDISLVPADFAAALADPWSLLWVDFSDEPDTSCEAILRDTFGFHPLAIDDAIRESHVPKVDDWGKYLYLVLHGLSLDSADGETLETRELDIFLGPNYLVTHHEQPLECLEQVWLASLKDERMTGGGAARLLYHLVDELVAGHMPVVDALDEEMERIEEQTLGPSGR